MEVAGRRRGPGDRLEGRGVRRSRGAGDLGGVGHDDVIGDVAAHGGQVEHGCDAERRHLDGRTDPRAPEQERVLHDPCRQDHLPAAASGAVGQLDADGPAPLDHHPAHVGVGLHHQVPPASGGLEVRGVGRDPVPVDPVHRDRPDAGGVGFVVVGAPGHADGLAPGHEPGLERCPRRLLPPGDRDGPVVAVPVAVAELLVGLEHVQRRQQVGPLPAGRPPVDVGRLGAEGDGPVGGRGATDPAAAAVVHPPPSGGLDLVSPVVGPGHGLAERAQLGREVVHPVVGSGLEEQHPPVGVLAEPGGEHAAGGSGADDDRVEGVARAAHRGIWLQGRSLSTRTSPGSPSTRSPRMLRMISEVPPSMVLARERRKRPVGVWPPPEWRVMG